jgi:hypothetical protein
MFSRNGCNILGQVHRSGHWSREESQGLYPRLALGPWPGLLPPEHSSPPYKAQANLELKTLLPQLSSAGIIGMNSHSQLFRDIC